MSTLLIASAGYISRSELEKVLIGNWDIHYCMDGLIASEMLEKLHPDAMIIDLNLPLRDGLSVLMEYFPELPPVILGVTSYADKHVIQTAASLGVIDILELPSSQFDIANHLNALNMTHLVLNTALGMHLLKLGISTKTDGYHYLYAAIPLCAEGGAVRFQKEIYPEVMRQCGASSVECVEHSIRFAIKDAWKRRDPKVWAKYFPVPEGKEPKCPTSKVFISTIAKML